MNRQICSARLGPSSPAGRGAVVGGGVARSASLPRHVCTAAGWASAWRQPALTDAGTPSLQLWQRQVLEHQPSLAVIVAVGKAQLPLGRCRCRRRMLLVAGGRRGGGGGGASRKCNRSLRLQQVVIGACGSAKQASKHSAAWSSASHSPLASSVASGRGLAALVALRHVLTAPSGAQAVWSYTHTAPLRGLHQEQGFDPHWLHSLLVRCA